MATPINDAFMRLEHRAEKIDPATLLDTFVDVGPLFTLLQSGDHQIVYGRRGTGKTHALQYLVASRRNAGDAAVYVDMRTIGSTGGLYSDPDLEITERGTRLLMDTLEAIHEHLVDDALRASYEGSSGDALSVLDLLAGQITEVRVVGGEVERITTVSEETGSESRDDTGVEIGTSGIGARLGGEQAAHSEERKEVVFRQKGELRHRVHFGAVSRTLERVVAALTSGGRLWIILDEWSVVPLDMQPLLADLLRRALFPVPNVVVKIGAIEHRSRFRVSAEGGAYVGIEIGADASADVNLDDFMVFGNDAEKASEFFRELLHKHVRATLAEEGREDAAPQSAGEMVRRGFTQANAFGELVRAAEGVPRDAMYIASLAAQSAIERQMSMNDVRSAARRWYQRDKEAALPERARELLNWIMDRVIRDRRARAFLLRQGEDTAHPLIGTLYDQRVLHVVKKSVAGRDLPGVRYDVYGLDYGCYVELTATAKAPVGLFEAEGENGEVGYVPDDVPQDDYRSIRRAILDLSEFDAAYPSTAVADSTGPSESVAVAIPNGNDGGDGRSDS